MKNNSADQMQIKGSRVVIVGGRRGEVFDAQKIKELSATDHVECRSFGYDQSRDGDDVCQYCGSILVDGEESVCIDCGGE